MKNTMHQTAHQSNTLHIVLWIAQGILAASLLWAACMKLLQPADTLAEMWPWTTDHAALVTATGILDLLAALGLVLPALLRIWPGLTVYAAYGTAMLMVAAMIFHISRGEASQIGINVFFAAVALFIAWGRQRKRC